MSQVTESAYEELHKATVDALLLRIKAGTATAADLGVARQLLRDNGISISKARGDTPLHELAEQVPFPTGTDD